MWAALTGGLLSFAVWVVEALRWYEAHHTSLLDGDSVPLSENLGGAVFWILVAAPLWTVPFGVVGAALGPMGPATRAARPGRP